MKMLSKETCELVERANAAKAAWYDVRNSNRRAWAESNKTGDDLRAVLVRISNGEDVSLDIIRDAQNRHVKACGRAISPEMMHKETLATDAYFALLKEAREALDEDAGLDWEEES